ncbi:MAG: carboxymuconolactone decarboxylase family protein [Trebonia sp.]|jgi:4-carboxymuconolactone decarboxylase
MSVAQDTLGNPALLNPGIGSSFLALQAAEEKYTSLDQRTRQVIILTVGAVWQAAYELFAHSAVARHAGLRDEAISALCRGELPGELSEKEQVAGQA